MNAKQRKFIEKKLIPFILREKGNGFVMENWVRRLDAGDKQYIADYGGLEFDYVMHARPACDTMACIGGSIQCLTRIKSKRRMAKEVLGLTADQVDGLFYNWSGEDGRTGWPKDLVILWDDAKTPLQKARVAVKVLRRVIKTNGACLNPEGDN